MSEPPVEETLVEVRRPHRPRPPLLWPWLLALLVIVLVGLGGLLWLTRDDDEQPRRVELRALPSVVGQPVEDASAELTSRGFVTDVSRRQGTGEPGTVIDQRPAAGSRLREGSRIQLVVATAEEEEESEAAPATTATSAQPKPKKPAKKKPATKRPAQKKPATAPVLVTVPDVGGLPVDEAEAALSGAGLEARQFEVPSSEPRGTVVAQSPLAGARVRKDAPVRLNVSDASSRDPPPPRTARVPDLVDIRLKAARRVLRERGLAADVVYVPSQKPEGRVVSQHPKPGREVPRGTQVRVNVSEGPEPRPRVTVPEVVGLPEQDAIAMLEDAGFVVEIIDEETPDPAEDGIVLRQEPTGQTTAPPRSAVAIYVGRSIQ